MRYFLTLTALLFAWAAQGADTDSITYIYPIREVARLYSANFGEMRPGHLHAGIDIKTDGV